MEEKKLRILDVKRRKKDYLLSVKRLNFKRERRVEQSDKDYARAHTHCF